ncbi:TonB-dependent receptor [uncultured Sphingomonas sp.]|uniref:TonB-dependent receptor n=1 Tax=uncultured Sphingomonas sp. TaxID=158754 RepID=UPI0025F3B6F0|nr:TonB-dependent receptor [uncultured Sphingomonas sp.]
MIERKTPGFLALSCVGFIASSLASPAIARDKPTELEGASVVDSAMAEDVKVERLESPKYNQPLLDIPQTITVISSLTLQQQNLISLRDALTTIPGITFGAGEGGGGVGDSFNLRGFSALTDVTIDGVRDSAQYNRSDTFNLEQVEVINGANSVFGGSGSIGGTINLVTKRPKATDQVIVQGGIGTDDYWRGTADANVRTGNVALRLNVMGHKNDIPGRDFEHNKRWGVAPSVTFGIEGPTRLTALYLHQKDRNIPVYGVPYYASLGGLLPGADYGGYYGYENIDRQRQTVNQATVILEHDFSDRLSLRNLTRFQRVDYDTYVDPPQGAFCLATGLLTNGDRCAAGQTPGTFYPSGPRGTARLTDTSIWYNQLDLRANFQIAGMENTLTVGGSISQEDYHIRNGNVLRNPNGATPNPVLDPISISDPHPIYTGPVNFIQSNVADGDTFNKAVYLFDTLNITPQIELNGAVRYEGQRTVYRTDTLGTTPATIGQYTRGPDQVSDDSLFSYRVGLVYKPVPNASLYAAYGNSRTPVSSGVRSGCGTPGTQTINTDPCSAQPQEAVNYEVGGKLDLFDARLQLTAALFRNDRTNYPVAANDPSIGTVQINDGRSRVDGIALGATGRITPAWTIFANYTYLDSKVKQSISNYCLANPGGSFTPVGGTPVSCPASDTQRGNPLTQVPKHAGSLFTTYTLPFGLQLGYGVTYTGSFLLNNTAQPHYKSDDWLIHRAMLSYPFTDQLSGQINVQNITDKKYYTGIRNNGWATPGEGRSAVFSLIYAF